MLSLIQADDAHEAVGAGRLGVPGAERLHFNIHGPLVKIQSLAKLLIFFADSSHQGIYGSHVRVIGALSLEKNTHGLV